MSDVVGIEKITDRAGTGAPDFTNGFNIAGSDSGISPHAHTEGATEPSSPSNGDAWLDTDNNIYKVYIDGEWKDWLGTSAPTGVAWGGTRHVYSCWEGSGSSGINTDTIQYFSSVASAGTTAQDFGNLSVARLTYAATSSQTRGLFIGSTNGSNISSNTSGQVIDYITIATTGNATDFGNLYFIEGGAYVIEAQNATGKGFVV